MSLAVKTSPSVSTVQIVLTWPSPIRHRNHQALHRHFTVWPRRDPIKVTRQERHVEPRPATRPRCVPM